MRMLLLSILALIIVVVPVTIIVVGAWREYWRTKQQRVHHREKFKQIHDLIAEVEKKSKK